MNLKELMISYNPFLFILLGLLCHSCLLGDCKKIPLKKSYAEWYDGLPNEGDTLLFKGSNNTIDSFLITNKFLDYSPCNRIELSDYQYGSFTLTGKMINSKIRYNNEKYFNIKMESTNDSPRETYQYLQLFDVYLEGRNGIDSLHLEYIDSIAKKDLGVHLVPGNSNVYRYNSDDLISVKDFWWSRKRGLIRYTTEDGVTYEFWKKI